MSKHFIRSERGSVFVFVALSAMAVIGAVGVAVDIGRSQLTQSKLQNAVDAAGLAASASVNVNDSDLTAIATKYININFNDNTMGATLGPVQTTLSEDEKILTVTADAILPTTITKVLGRNSVQVNAVTEITRSNRGLELVLVLDNTGSMLQPAGGGTTKLAAAKAAAISLLNILYGNANTVPNLWIGIVPFSQAVNIGTDKSAWLDPTPLAAPGFGPVATLPSGGNPGRCSVYNSVAGTYSLGPRCAYTLPIAEATPNFNLINWHGCVEARGNGTASPQYDINDDPPSVRAFKPYLYPNNTNSNTWYSATNTNCTGGVGSTCKGYTWTVNGCTTSYPSCCPANSEGCTNPPNCGLPSYKYDCNVCTGGWTASTPATCTGKRHTFDYSTTTWLGTNKGPNTYCPRPMQPMVAEKDTLIATINGMTATGETQVNLGMAWGWRMLSPRWRGLWGGQMNAQNLPLDYNTPLMTKVVILMSDGDNNMVGGTYSAYGLTNSNQLGVTQCTGSNCAVGISALNTRTSTVCTNMKNQGILIYTIALGTSLNATSETMLRNCASSPAHFFLSPTTSDLQGVFQRIASSLANLRISK